MDVGGLTYGYTKEEGLEEGIVFGSVLEDLSIIGYVYENCQGVFSYGLNVITSACMADKSYNWGNSTHLVILHQEL